MSKILTFLLLIIISSLSSAQNVNSFIPKNALLYVPVLKTEQLKYWKDHPKPELLASLGEQESCISLTNKKCWDPRVKLDTPRELGVGILQLTKAYNKNGSIRFDALQELRDRHMKELSDLSWSNIFSRPDLQLASLVLKNHDNYKTLFTIKDPIERLNFNDYAYNGGLGGVSADRRLCSLTKGCNPQIWFGNVEKTCSKSKQAIYGTRSACDISREHVKYVIKVRSPKYKILMSSYSSL